MGNSWPVFKQIFWINLVLLVCVVFFHMSGCTSRRDTKKSEVWIYTSLYRDTIQELEPKLEQAFPKLKVNFFQAPPEEIAAKVNAEMLSGGTKADLVISSDRFWLEELAQKDMLQPYNPPGAADVLAEFRNPKGFYTAVALPAMVIGYNSESLGKNLLPKTFKELADEKWKGKVSTGSPLASSTYFTMLAMLQNRYSWEMIQRWKRNQWIAEGGNSAVMRRIQTKERGIGIVLLENILRFKNDTRMKFIFPEDGVIFEPTSIAIVKKIDANFDAAQKLVDWIFTGEAQQVMVRSFMYSALPNAAPPEGAPAFQEVKEKAFHWTEEFLASVVQERVRIKEKFAELMFNE